MISKILDKFNGGRWRVLYRERGKDTVHRLEDDKFFWYADPFLFNYKGKKYLFVEGMDIKKQIGRICVSKWGNGKFGMPNVIIAQPYHMSYPCVFSVHNKVYMLPETVENRTLEIYVAKEFPEVWEKVTLKENVSYVDSTVYMENQNITVICFDQQANKSDVYKLDIEKMSLEYVNSTLHDKNIFRPGGGIFKKNEKLYRPVQNCTARYGGSLIINQLVDLYTLEEKKVYEIFPKDIDEEYIGLHTLGCDEELEVIDVYENQGKSIKFFMNSVKRKMHGIYIKKTNKHR